MLLLFGLRGWRRVLGRLFGAGGGFPVRSFLRLFPAFGWRRRFRGFFGGFALLLFGGWLFAAFGLFFGGWCFARFAGRRFGGLFGAFDRCFARLFGRLFDAFGGRFFRRRFGAFGASGAGQQQRADQREHQG